VLVIVCYVLMYSADCSVVMPWWVVGEGSVVNVQCYYRVCETAHRHSPQEVLWKLEGLDDSSHSVCYGGGTRRRDVGQTL